MSNDEEQRFNNGVAELDVVWQGLIAEEYRDIDGHGSETPTRLDTIVSGLISEHESRKAADSERAITGIQGNDGPSVPQHKPEKSPSPSGVTDVDMAEGSKGIPARAEGSQG